jgi:hypothetical protein
MGNACRTGLEQAARPVYKRPQRIAQRIPRILVEGFGYDPCHASRSLYLFFSFSHSSRHLLVARRGREVPGITLLAMDS